MTLTRLTRPLVRRIGRLVVRIDRHGVWVRGYRRRKWRRFTWEQVASLALPGDGEAVMRLAETAAGTKVLHSMGAVPNNDKPA